MSDHATRVFHPLRWRPVEPVTEDSVAITFAVPDGAADDYDFTPASTSPIRTELAGDDVRRNYSICSPAGSGVLRVARQAAARRGVLRARARRAPAPATCST